MRWSSLSMLKRTQNYSLSTLLQKEESSLHTAETQNASPKRRAEVPKHRCIQPQRSAPLYSAWKNCLIMQKIASQRRRSEAAVTETVFSPCLDYLPLGGSKRWEGEQDCCPCFCAGKGVKQGTARTTLLCQPTSNLQCARELSYLC